MRTTLLAATLPAVTVAPHRQFVPAIAITSWAVSDVADATDAPRRPQIRAGVCDVGARLF